MKKQQTTKQDKKDLLPRIISIISLVVSALALLLGCSSIGSKTTQEKVQVSERSNAIATDYFLYEDNYAYYVKDQNTGVEYQTLFTYLDNMLPTDISASITVVVQEIENASIYSNVVDITNINPASCVLVYRYNDNGNIVYPTVTLDFDDLGYYRYGLIIKFNNPFIYNVLISSYFSSLVKLYSLDSAYSFYYEKVTFALIGAFVLNNTYGEETFNFSGSLNYYNAGLSYITFNFNSIKLAYNGGLWFYSNEHFIKPYTATISDKQTRFSIQYFNENINKLVSITNVVLGQKALLNLPKYLIELGEIYEESFNLATLYYSQNPKIAGASYENIYNFTYKSNGQTFTNYKLTYVYHETPYFFWRYVVAYGTNGTYDNVLWVDGQPRVNGAVGSAVGYDYSFRVRNAPYQTFIIYDYYNADIQRFQIKSTDITLSNSLPVGGNQDLGTALDVIVSVFTALLPFLSFQIFPNLTIGVLILIPFFITLMLFVFNMFKR